jgi:hypothetical protein
MHSKEPPLAPLREAILTVVPELQAGSFHVLNSGWDSVAVEAGGWIFKFPRRTAAIERLRKECRILSLIRSRVPIAVPDMVLHETPVLFSQHRKLPGGFLESKDYAQLDNRQRDAVADKMAGLYVVLHAIPKAEVRAAGVTAIDPWLAPQQVARCAPHLPDDLRLHLEPTLEAYAAIPADPVEEVYGYFDGHGWNMAFDNEAMVLNGVYDFADSGFGARHQDFSYSNWISRDLTLRIIARYERMTGHVIDRDLVMLYSQMLRFVEFAQAAPDDPDLPARLAALREWFTWGP